jgi:iron complex outermembrane receptor protein
MHAGLFYGNNRPAQASSPSNRWLGFKGSYVKNKSVLAASALFATSVISPHWVLAQASTDGAQLMEIVVTAQKREEDSQRTPVTVQALGQESLVAANVFDFSNFTKVAPNVQVFTQAGATVLAIRGIRSTSFDPTDESPIAVNIDGNYIARSSAINGLFYDIERVEVLPGPQGTLFGRNAAAGAINIVTKKPSTTEGFAGDAEVEVGSYNLIRYSGGVNLPVSDSLAFRVATDSVTRDGYYKNGFDDEGQKGVRAQMLFTPTSDIKWLVGLDRESLKYQGSSNNIVESYNPSIPVPSPRDNSFYVGDGNRGKTNTQIWGANTQLDWGLGFASLTIDASHRSLDNHYNTDTGHGSYGYLTGFDSSTTAEARLTSMNTPSVEWVAGIFGFRDNASGDNSSFITIPTVGPIQTFGISLPGTSTSSGAAFGQATWRIIDPLRLTAGLRYTHDEKSGSSSEFLLLSPVLPPIQYTQPTASFSNSKVTWKVGVAYDVLPTSMLFANVSTGFKSGGIVYGPQPIAAPQTIKAYEFGSKNQFLDNKLQLNVTVFRDDYDNFEQTYLSQFPNPAGGPPLTLLAVASAGSARVQGADIEFQAIPTQHDYLTFHVDYLDAKFGELDLTRLGPGQLNLTGTQLPNTPKWAGTAGYRHIFDLPSNATLEAGANAQFSVRRGVALVGSYLPDGSQIESGGYAILDLYGTYHFPDKHWSVTAYVNNATNKVSFYNAAYNNSGAYANTVSGYLLPPRVVGVRVGLNF